MAALRGMERRTGPNAGKPECGQARSQRGGIGAKMPPRIVERSVESERTATARQTIQLSNPGRRSPPTPVESCEERVRKPQRRAAENAEFDAEKTATNERQTGGV